MRADIQLLRGVAVLAVMLSHFGNLLPGGFLGVDIFFAISGFVITLSFIRLWSLEPDRRKILRTFWKKRFWRLFPALSLVLSVTLAFAFFLLEAEDFRDQLEMTVWSFFFAGNVGVEVVSREDYFDPAASFNWLLHLWSLGVEEQFYLIFPFLMIFSLSRFRKSSQHGILIAAVAVLSVFSFLLAGLDEFERGLEGSARLTELTGVSAALGYYSPLTRGWQFGVGVLAALLSLRNPGVRAPSIIPAVGLMVIGLSLWFMPESNLLPGPLTIFPMAAMFLLLISPPSEKLANAAAFGPLRWLGDRSYSAYLWHWPVWSVLTALGGEGAFAIVGSLITTLVLATLTYRFIERPLINRHRARVGEAVVTKAPSRASRVALGTFLLWPLIFVVGAVGTESAMRKEGLIGQRTPVPRISQNLDCIQSPCNGVQPDVLLIGDSHAGALADALAAELGEHGLEMRAAIVARHFGCLHLPSQRISSIHPECTELSDEVRDLILTLSPPTVILHGYTAGRFTTINSGGEQEISLVDRQTGLRATPESGPSFYELALAEVRDLVLAVGAELIIVSGTPDFALRPEDAGRDGDPASFAEMLLSGITNEKFGQATTRAAQLERHGPFREVEKIISLNDPRVSWIDPWETLCDVNSCSQIGPSGAALFSDQDHLSAFGAQLVAKAVADEIVR